MPKKKTLPDLTYFLDLEPEILLQRINLKKAKNIEYFDTKGLEFHNQVRMGYLNLCYQYPGRIYKVDVSCSLKEVKTTIIEIIRKHLNLKI